MRLFFLLSSNFFLVFLKPCFPDFLPNLIVTPKSPPKVLFPLHSLNVDRPQGPSRTFVSLFRLLIQPFGFPYDLYAENTQIQNFSPDLHSKPQTCILTSSFECLICISNEILNLHPTHLSKATCVLSCSKSILVLFSSSSVAHSKSCLSPFKIYLKFNSSVQSSCPSPYSKPLTT